MKSDTVYSGACTKRGRDKTETFSTQSYQIFILKGLIAFPLVLTITHHYRPFLDNRYKPDNFCHVM